MVRAYKVKGLKRKKKEEKYDREEEAEQLDEKVADSQPRKKVKTELTVTDEEKKLEQLIDEMLGIPIALADMSNMKSSVIFILENVSLEIGKVGKTYQLLSSDEHANFLIKNKRNPADYRPHIAFRAIQTILDSRVNESGRLKALYVKTQQGLLLDIKPLARMPREYKSFSCLMVQLLQKMHINATGTGEKKLLRVIKNPVTKYLPINCRKIGFSRSSDNLVGMYNYVDATNNDSDLVFVVGAMPHGKIEEEYVDEYISISNIQ